jgi:hypothetical protein
VPIRIVLMNFSISVKKDGQKDRFFKKAEPEYDPALIVPLMPLFFSISTP